MKKIIYLLCICMMVGGLLSACATATGPQSPKAQIEAKSLPELTFYQATDLHYLSEKLTDNGAFYKKLSDDGDGKVLMYSEELIQAFVAQMIKEQPSILILSGDLTLNGERVSHEDLAAKLQTIEDSGTQVLVMPGNHDLNNRMAAKFKGDGYELVPSIDTETFKAIYHNFGFKQALSQDPSSASYVYAVNEHLWLLMVDVNTKEAPGSLRPETLNWVKQQLASAKRAGVRVIGVSHQNLVKHNALFTGGFMIGGGEDLTKVYEENGVLLNLSGHMHIQHYGQSPGGLTEIAASSLAVTPNQYGVFRLSEGKLSYETKPVDVSRWAAGASVEGKVVRGAKLVLNDDLKDFAGYSKGYFETISKAKLLGQIKVTPRAEAAADVFAALNTAYFTGRMASLPEDPGISSYEEVKATFLADYIESIKLAEGKDYNHLVIQIK